ncbi:acetyl-CoA synthetase-like protein [Xylariomycetidae sp. FL2044]|nr:acetyl-CoA synthetase-like protein [Xylariomycetidae sp. FL2044]
MSLSSSYPIFPGPLLDGLRNSPSTPVFEHGPRVVTRGRLLTLIASCAGGLRSVPAASQRDADTTTTIALSTGVTPEGFAVQIAAHVLGWRVVVLKAGMPALQLAHVLGDVSFVVVDDSAEPEVLAQAKSAIHIRDLQGAEVELKPCGNPETVALVMYTSGTTGEPKGVECTYASLTRSWPWDRRVWVPEIERLASRYQRYMLFGTLASRAMLEHLALCITSGGTAVIPERLEFPSVLSELRITASIFTVARLNHTLDALQTQDTDTSAMGSVLVSGSVLPPSKLRAAIDRFGDAVHLAYGTSETGLVSVLSAADVAAFPNAAGSVGRPWPGVEACIRDDNGTSVPTGTIGHIWVRTSGAFSGYTNEDSSNILVDGWVSTRDIGSLDAEGFLHLRGRSRDIVIVNAIVQYAGAIEAVLASHPEVDSAYVFSVPDEHTGEAVCAYVVPTEGHETQVDFNALRALVKKKLGELAVPSTIETLDQVPLALGGKPDKMVLRTKFMEKHLP